MWYIYRPFENNFEYYVRFDFGCLVIETEIMTQIGEKLISSGNFLSIYIGIHISVCAQTVGCSNRIMMLDSHLFSIRAIWYCTMWHIHYHRTVQENDSSMVFLNCWHLSHKCSFGKFSYRMCCWYKKYANTVRWSYPLALVERKQRLQQKFPISKRSPREANEKEWKKNQFENCQKWMCFFVSFLLSRCLMAKFFSFTLLNHFLSLAVAVCSVVPDFSIFN